MQIKALKTFRHGAGNIRRGATTEIPDAQAKDLIKAGLAEEAKGKSRSKAAPDGQDGTDLSAADLIARADEMPFQAWKAEAKKLLGDHTPSKKEEIIEALQAKADEA